MISTSGRVKKGHAYSDVLYSDEVHQSAAFGLYIRSPKLRHIHDEGSID